MMKKRVLLLGTGGTISCEESESGLSPRNDVRRLLEYAGFSDADTEVSAEQLFMLDSTNMTPRRWELLARRICERWDEFDGFVILHGTDTLAYAAAALYCLIENPKKPVVLTGSMKPMTAEGSDAPDNLRSALRLAAADGAHGVIVAFGGRLISGRCARKIHTSDKTAFESVSFPYLDAKALPPFSGETRFYDKLDDGVIAVKLIPGQALSVPVREGLKAVIIESFGAGGVPDDCYDEIKRLRGEGVYVVISTQTPYGGTDLREYEAGRKAADELGLYETGKATTEYALAKAQQLLAAGENRSDKPSRPSPHLKYFKAKQAPKP